MTQEFDVARESEAAPGRSPKAHGCSCGGKSPEAACPACRSANSGARMPASDRAEPLFRGATASGHDFGQVSVLPGEQVDAGEPPTVDAGTTPTQANTGSAGTGASPAGGGAAPACPHPINWVHGPGARDNGPDGIQIDISWDSSTGNLADLGNCQVREVVSYDPIPDPPFAWNPPNPTILTVAANLGAGQDTHSYPLGLGPAGIRRPLVSGTMVAHQVYQWRCTGPNCTGNWTDWPGETYDITREVLQAFVFVNPWRYRITKQGTGAGNSFHYTRMVEITP